jgi:phosphate/sulfate permease
MILLLKLLITVFFEVIGNVFLSKYILVKTVSDTINYQAIFNKPDLISTGFLSLGCALMSSALIMMNVTIFALPMSSTQIMFSGLAGVTIAAFWSIEEEIVKVEWLIIELIIWIFSPIIAVGLTIGMYVRGFRF